MDKIEFKQRNINKVVLRLIPYGFYLLAYFWLLTYSPYSDSMAKWADNFTGPYVILALIFAGPAILPLGFVFNGIQSIIIVSFLDDKITINNGREKSVVIPYIQLNALKLNHPNANTLTLLSSDDVPIYTFRPMNNDVQIRQIVEELSNRIKFKVEVLKPIIYFKVIYEAKTYTKIL